MDLFDKLEDFLGSEDATKEYMAKINPRDHCDQLQILFQSKTIQELFNQEDFTKVKSKIDGKRFRDLGNEAYKQSRDVKALELYDRSCLASTNDKELALVLANRSAATLRLENYEAALKNVDWAINIGTYPLENLYKLHDRRAKILVKLSRNKEASNEYIKASQLVKDINKASQMLKLSQECLESISSEEPRRHEATDMNGFSFSMNDRYPGFSDNVDIHFEEDRGRFGVAARDIEVGELIAIEEPLICRLKKAFEQSHCHTCLSYLQDYTFLPCLNCKNARYCSIECKAKSAKEYHRYECGLSTFLEDALVKMKAKASDAEDYYRLGFRSIAQKPLEYFCSNYKAFLGADINKPKSYFPSDYTSLSSLVENCQNDIKGNLWSQISACFLIRSLREKGYFGVYSAKKMRSKVLSGDERIIASLSRVFLDTLRYNTHGIIECMTPYKETSSRVFANGVYTNLALLNHSCAPNITKHFVGSKAYVVASCGIAKGEEISENYFPYYIFMEKAQRRDWLRDHYAFECSCRACDKEYPLLSQMKESAQNKFLCPSCKGVLRKAKDSKDKLVCSACSKTFLSENLKNDIIGLMDELQSRFDAEDCPGNLLSIGRKLLSKLQEPDPYLYKFQKLYCFSLKYAHGNKI